MITHMHIENYKCFKRFDIDLDPFNVLIGPNDSGKTAFLMAMRLLAASAQIGTEVPNRGEHCIWHGSGGPIRISGVASRASEPAVDWATQSHDGMSYGIPQDWQGRAWESERQRFQALAGRVVYFRLNPTSLRQQTPAGRNMTEAGDGFPSFLDAFLRADRRSFSKMEDAFYRRFPFYSDIAIELVARPSTMAVAFKTRQGQKLPAESVSDGVMLSLAYFALAYSPDPPGVMLIEEPENGIYYANLKETIDTLKLLSTDKGVQIIMTTHSPYLLDYVEPKQVRIFRKDNEGAVHAFRLSDHPEVENLKKHFKTGEMWTGLEEDADFDEKLGAQR